MTRCAHEYIQLRVLEGEDRARVHCFGCRMQTYIPYEGNEARDAANARWALDRDGKHGGWS